LDPGGTTPEGRHVILDYESTAAARDYLEHGLDIHPVPQTGDHKTPVPWWAKRRAEAGDFQPPCNIGLKTGAEIRRGAFVADADLDMKIDLETKQMFPGANVVVDELLPECQHIFGRPGAPGSHRIYITQQPVTTTRYPSVHGHGVLIELRGAAKKSRKPQQTVIPPGLHHTGEPIRWERMTGYEFTAVDADVLHTCVLHAAVALAILEIWPHMGLRHDARLAFSKVLLEANLDSTACAAILRAVVRATGGDVDDVQPCVESTRTRLADDPRQAVGVAWVQEHLGDAGLRTVAAIQKMLGVTAPPKGLLVDDMDLKAFTPQIWSHLRETNEPPRVFLQGGLPVRVAHIPERRDLKKQTFVFQPAALDVLRHEVAKVQRFCRTGRGGHREIAPPDVLLRNMLATPPADILLPVVTRIVYAPTVALDGSIQLTPGYQPATGTFFVANGLAVPPVPITPSEDDVSRAVATLLEPIREFPFVGESDIAHALAFLLLPFVRDLIDGPTPLHLFEKSTAGEGASLLTDVLLYPAVGGDIARLTPCDDDDEWRKSITSTLLEGPLLVMIDNARSLVSPQLAKVLTDRIWQARILGFSRNATLDVECVWGATGINPTLHQEIVRRVVRCRLDSGEERPWLRTGWTIPDLRSWSREHRASMIQAALIVVRRWFARGQPKGQRVLGMFESWAQVIGGILETAGISGFLTGLEEFYEEVDVEGDAIRWLFCTWRAQHQSNPVTLQDVGRWALADDSPVRNVLPSSSESGTRQAFGAFIRRLRRRVVNVGGTKMLLETVRQSTNVSRNTYRIRPTTADTTGTASVADGLLFG
jgi:hypothetical protein